MALCWLHVGAFWPHSGTILASTWPILLHLASSWPHLDCILARLSLMLAPLGWLHLGAFWPRPSSILASIWHILPQHDTPRCQHSAKIGQPDPSRGKVAPTRADVPSKMSLLPRQNSLFCGTGYFGSTRHDQPGPHIDHIGAEMAPTWVQHRVQHRPIFSYHSRNVSPTQANLIPTWHKLAPTWPNVGQRGSNTGRLGPNIGQYSLSRGHHGPNKGPREPC